MNLSIVSDGVDEEPSIYKEDIKKIKKNLLNELDFSESEIKNLEKYIAEKEDYQEETIRECEKYIKKQCDIKKINEEQYYEELKKNRDKIDTELNIDKDGNVSIEFEPIDNLLCDVMEKKVLNKKTKKQLQEEKIKNEKELKKIKREEKKAQKEEQKRKEREDAKRIRDERRAQKEKIKEEERKEKQRKKEEKKKKEDDEKKMKKSMKEIEKMKVGIDPTEFDVKLNYYKPRHTDGKESKELTDMLKEENDEIFINQHEENIILKKHWLNLKNGEHVLNGYETKIKTYEFIKQDDLNFILKNKIKITKILRKGKRGQKEIDELFECASNYLRKSNRGVIPVNYFKKKGRLYAKHGLSLQGLMREIRQTICDDNYIDIDIKNSHPTCLLFFCKKNNIQSPMLEHYVLNREECLKNVLDITSNREGAKRLLISALNNGFFENKKNEFYNNFCLEIKNIIETIINKYKKKYEIFEEDYEENDDEKKGNPKGGFMSLIMSEIEGFILDEIYNFFNKPLDAVLIFDGLMLRMKDGENVIFYKKKIKKFSKYFLKKYDLKINLVIKPFEDKIKLPENRNTIYTDILDCEFKRNEKSRRSRKDKFIKIIQNSNELNETINEVLCGDITHEAIAELIKFYFDGDLICSNAEGKGVYYFYNFLTGMWKKDTGLTLLSNILYDNIIPYIDNLCKNLYHKYEKLKREWRDIDDLNTDKLKKMKKAYQRFLNFSYNFKGLKANLKNNVFINNAFSILKTKIYDENFEDKCDLQKHYFAFDNGIIFNLNINKTQKPKKKDFVTMTCGYNYNEPKQEFIDELNEEVINKILPEEEERNFTLRRFSKGLIGEVSPDILILFNVKGRNGKNVLCDLMRITAGKYGYKGNADTLMSSGKMGGSNPEMASLHKIRFAYYSEPKDPLKVKFSSSILKTLTEGQINARMNYSNNCKVINHCLTVVLANHVPRMDECTPAIEDRLNLIKFKTFFATKSEYKKLEKLRQKEELKFLQRRNPKYISEKFYIDYRCAFFSIMRNTYFNYYKRGQCEDEEKELKKIESVVKDTRDYLDNGSDLIVLLLKGSGEDEPIIMKGGEKDFIQIKEIYELFKDTEFYENIKDKTKFSQRKFSSELKASSVFSHNIIPRKRKTINKKVCYFYDLINGYKKYEKQEDEFDNYRIQDCDDSDDSDDEEISPMKSPIIEEMKESNIKIKIKKIKKKKDECLFD